MATDVHLRKMYLAVELRTKLEQLRKLRLPKPGQNAICFNERMSLFDKSLMQVLNKKIQVLKHWNIDELV